MKFVYLPALIEREGCLPIHTVTEYLEDFYSNFSRWLSMLRIGKEIQFYRYEVLYSFE